jgi:predicted N-acyltransferase
MLTFDALADVSQPIYGRRWNCVDCLDFDFCFKCNWSAADTHPEHRFDPRGQGPDKQPLRVRKLLPRFRERVERPVKATSRYTRVIGL